MRWGVTGLVAFTLATILSVRVIRNRFFEFFLISHIVLIGSVKLLPRTVNRELSILSEAIFLDFGRIFLVGGYIHARAIG